MRQSRRSHAAANADDAAIADADDKDEDEDEEMLDGHGNDTIMNSQSILQVANSLPLSPSLSLSHSHCLRFGLCRVLLNVLKHE